MCHQDNTAALHTLAGGSPSLYLDLNCVVQVNPDVLNLLLDYCRFHRAPGRSDKVGYPQSSPLCVHISVNNRI